MILDDLLNSPTAPWITCSDDKQDIVLSSRLRLARNIVNMPFPNRAQPAHLNQIIEKVKEALHDLKSANGQVYSFIRLSDISPLDRYVLVEKHIISPAHAQEAEGRALLLSEDGSVSIMINEEDHVRLQCLKPGLDLPETWELANKIDDALEAKLDYAYCERFGYLTACPTNLGTGLRASVMVHLPGLVFTRQINRVIHAVTQVGLAVRGLYGEGSDAAGNIFQISNQLTMGNTEKEIIANLQSVVLQLVEKERTARELLYKEAPEALVDRVWRAYGVLSYARKLSGEEALSLLSEVQLGVDLEIISGVSGEVLKELLVSTGANYLQKLAGNRSLDQKDRDSLRAKVVRDHLQNK